MNGMSADGYEVMRQLFLNGPTWDGDLVSKEGRRNLLSLDFAVRYNGWQTLTEQGLKKAVDIGFSREKDRG